MSCSRDAEQEDREQRSGNHADCELENGKWDGVHFVSIENFDSLSRSKFPGKWVGQMRRTLRSQVRVLVPGKGQDESITKSVKFCPRAEPLDWLCKIVAYLSINCGWLNSFTYSFSQQTFTEFSCVSIRTGCIIAGTNAGPLVQKLRIWGQQQQSIKPS